MPSYQLGDSGPAVAEIRASLARLGLLADGGDDVFDRACDRAVRAFQQSRGLTADGIVGLQTYRALDETRWRLGDRVLSYAIAKPFVGDDVVELQQWLSERGFDPGRVDGIFGHRTEAALREFQRNVDLKADGMCGPQTLKALQRLSRTVSGGHAHAMREVERLRHAAHTLSARAVLLDPGHGGDDPGATAHGLIEAELMADLAARIEGRLVASGLQVYLTRGPDMAADEADRAAFANAAEGDLFISLHTDASADPAANGVATYWFGSSADGGRRMGSVVGARFAQLVQDEIVARTDLLDCRTHAKTWDLLRLTRMPAVRIDLGYLTNAGDAQRLASAAFRDTVAEAVLVAVQRLYLPDLDAAEGERAAAREPVAALG